MLQLTYTPNKKFKATIRYKSELKQQNTNLDTPINFLDNVNKRLYTASFTWQKSKAISIQGRLELVHYQKGAITSENGYLICQDIDYSPPAVKVSANVRLAYFHSQGYDSRMYAYEDDVLYNIGFGMYNGKGWRTYFNLKYKFLKEIDFWFRYAVFFYPKATSVGSGLDEILGRTKSDIKLQLKFQL